MRTLLAIAILVGWSATARADLVSPEIIACRNATKGSSCDDEIPGGTCEESTCGRIDHSSRNSGGPLKTIAYPCLKCVAPKPGAVPAKKSSGCSEISGAPTTRELCALALAGAFSLLFLLRRRRAR
jgi:hypothetical protein